MIIKMEYLDTVKLPAAFEGADNPLGSRVRVHIRMDEDDDGKVYQQDFQITHAVKEFYNGDVEKLKMMLFGEALQIVGHDIRTDAVKGTNIRIHH